MFSTRITAAVVGSRFDPGYYDPEYLRDEGLLRRFPQQSLDSLRHVDAPIRYGVIKPRFQASEVLMVRIQDFDDPFVALDRSESIEPAQMEEFARAACAPGDLLLAIGGYPGRLGIVPPFPPGTRAVNINQHVARVRFSGEAIDPYFVVVFFLSSIGRRSLTRQVSGSVQAGVNLEDLRKIPIPVPARDAQAYIGNKVRQAETLRARARALETAFKASVSISVPLLAKPARFSRLASTAIGADLNPGRYDPDRLQVRTALLSNGGLDLASFARIQTPTAEPTAPTQTYLGLDGIHSSSIDLTVDTVAAAGISGTCRRLLLGPAISKLRPYLNKVAYISPDMAGAIGSTELLCVDSNGVHPGFVYGVLKLDTTLRQLNPVATGATHPRVSSNDVLEVIVPTHDDHERLGRSLETAQQQYWAARRLTNAARLLVEALIERKITEKDLIAAHKDAAADRALLARLSADGLDGDGEPLFPDLDRLEELLEEARPGDER